MTFRLPAKHRTAVVVASAAVAAAISVATAGDPPAAGAAQVSLFEVPASPIVADLGPDPLSHPGQQIFSSAAVSDVTGDGTPEIIVGSIGSTARVFALDGSLVAEVDPGDADPASGRGAIQSSPTIADIDGNGIDDVVITNLAGRVAAYSMVGGVPATIYNHFAPPAFEGAGVGLFGTPAVGYLDRDGQLDVVTSSWGQTVDAWSGPTGQPLPYLRQWVKDTIWSSSAIGDIDGDGAVEIVVGGDCEGLGSGGEQPCSGIGQGGYVWAFNLDGTLQWSYFVRDAVVWSSPALTDLNHDGALDVVVGTGIYFDRPGADRIRALDGRTGQLLWEGATPGRVMGSPSVATVGGEQRVWVMSEGGWLLSWNEAGQELWRQCVSDQPCNDSLGTFGGVAIADVNNDGTLDAIVQAEAHLRVLDAETGAIEAVTASRYTGVRLASSATPTVASIGGATWIIQVGIGDANNDHQNSANDHLLVTAWTTGTPLGEAPWPTFKQNMARTSGPLPTMPDPSAPGAAVPSRACTPVAGQPGDAAIVNMTPVEASGPGNGQLVSSDIAAPPVASNVNFVPGSIDPNVAIAPIGNDGQVCYVNSEHAWVHLVADHLGTITGDAYTPATPTGAPERKLDTRVGIGAQPLPVPALGRVCFRVAGSAGDAAIVNLTPVEAQGPGNGQLVSSSISNPPVASNVNYTAGSIDPNVAIAPIGSDGQVCYVNSEHAAIHLIADHLGTVRAGSYTPATADGAPDRKVDTRIGLGAEPLPVQPLSRACFPVSGAPGDAAIVNLTPVEASGPGNGQLVSSDIANPPVASNVNFNVGTFDPNVAIAPIGSDGQVCFVNSEHAAVHLVADHLGTIHSGAYTPATSTGAPERKIDTRTTGLPVAPS